MITPWFYAAMLATLGYLSQGPSQLGKVEITYVQNSGWIVKTSGHVLVFDYVDAIPGIEPLPPEADSVLEAIDARPLIVFASHQHADHYSPAILEWVKAKEPVSVDYVLGWTEPALPNARMTKPRESFSVKGVSVKTTASTDQGVGFLVTVDGVTLYHAGDHARWADGSAEAFEAEIRWLETEGARIDIAFVPIATGAACEPRPSIWQGALFATMVLKPKVLFPMHVRCPTKLDLYRQFGDRFSPFVQPTVIIPPSHHGESFLLSAAPGTGWTRGPKSEN